MKLDIWDRTEVVLIAYWSEHLVVVVGNLYCID